MLLFVFYQVLNLVRFRPLVPIHFRWTVGPMSVQSSEPLQCCWVCLVCMPPSGQSVTQANLFFCSCLKVFRLMIGIRTTHLSSGVQTQLYGMIFLCSSLPLRDLSSTFWFYRTFISVCRQKTGA